MDLIKKISVCIGNSTEYLKDISNNSLKYSENKLKEILLQAETLEYNLKVESGLETAESR